MNLFYAILLGIIQGITEFLPISSTAHLTLAGKAMGLIDQAQPQDWTAFIAIIQLGTVAAVTLYFLRDLLQIAASFFRDLGGKIPPGTKRWSDRTLLGWKIVIGTLPVVVIGLLLRKIIEGAITKEVSMIATSMIGFAILLLLAEKVGKRNRTEAQTTWRDALVIGFAQALALIPGSSRSGTTITGGLFLGLTREAAARFSFLLSIPAVLASGLYEMYKERTHFADLGGIVPLGTATITAAIVGYAAIAFLLRYLRTHATYVFIWYRIALAIALWGMLLLKVI